MSINDLLEYPIFDESTGIIACFVIIILFVVGIAAVHNAKNVNKSIYGENEQTPATKEFNVIVIEKKASPHPLNKDVSINSILFEFENNSRVELPIKDINTYNTLVVGDCGTLNYAGKKFISFERNATAANRTFNENERKSTL